MPFAIPTLDESHELGLALAEALYPEDDTSQGSYLYRLTRVIAAMVADNHAHTFTAFDEILPDKSRDALLDRWGAILAILRKEATPARKANALRLTGTTGSTFAIGELLAHVSNLRFQVNENGSIPAAGFIDVDVVGVDKGSQTRLSAGEVLTFVSPLTGIAPTAELQLALDEDGDDAEQNGPYRLRILNRFQLPPLGGARNDYSTWALEVTGIAAAFTYPVRAGVGSVDLVALHAGRGTARILNASETDELQAYIDAKRPVSVVDFRVLDVVPQVADVEVTVQPLSATYQFDWVDQTPPLVASWSAGDRRLTLQAPRPLTLQAGGRVVIKTAGGTWASIAVESLPVTNTQLILESAPPVAPTNGDLVYAGGPLTEPCRAAVQALFDSLGTANPDAHRYGEWEGNLRVLDVGDAAKSVTGAYNPLVIAPAADVEAVDPAFPNDAEISLLVSRGILIRKRW